MFTKLPKKKQEPAVYLSLTGRAREAVGADDGLTKVMTKLDSIYLQDKSTRAFIAFKEFYDYRRSSGDKYADFIIQFEKFYNKIAKFDMVLPEAVQAYFLLTAANMSEDNEKLACTTCGELNYKNMKMTIMKIFGELNTAEDASQGGSLPVKEECMYGNARKNFDRKYNKGDHMRTRQNQNPLDKDGKLMRCHECESTKHFANKCPHRNSAFRNQQMHNSRTNNSDDKNEMKNDVHITLFAGIPDNRQYCLIGESFGKGILDSGCTKTVSGQVWIDEYLSTLPESDRNMVIEEDVGSTYRFGDGVEVRAIKNVIIPVTIGNQRYKLSVDVVKNSIPLFISRNTMKSLGMKLDFSTDTAVLNKERIDLHCTTTGHYCLPLTLCDLDERNKTKIVLHNENIMKADKNDKMKKGKEITSSVCTCLKGKAYQTCQRQQN